MPPHQKTRLSTRTWEFAVRCTHAIAAQVKGLIEDNFLTFLTLRRPDDLKTCIEKKEVLWADAPGDDKLAAFICTVRLQHRTSIGYLSFANLRVFLRKNIADDTDVQVDEHVKKAKPAPAPAPEPAAEPAPQPQPEEKVQLPPDVESDDEPEPVPVQVAPPPPKPTPPRAKKVVAPDAPPALPPREKQQLRRTVRANLAATHAEPLPATPAPGPEPQAPTPPPGPLRFTLGVSKPATEPVRFKLGN